MLTCRLCHFGASLDDAVVVTRGGQYICLRCFARETGTSKPMPKSLRSELQDLLTSVEIL